MKMLVLLGNDIQNLANQIELFESENIVKELDEKIKVFWELTEIADLAITSIIQIQKKENRPIRMDLLRLQKQAKELRYNTQGFTV